MNLTECRVRTLNFVEKIKFCGMDSNIECTANEGPVRIQLGLRPRNSQKWNTITGFSLQCAYLPEAARRRRVVKGYMYIPGLKWCGGGGGGAGPCKNKKRQKKPTRGDINH